ncbi:YfiR family protein [Desulfobacter latus]|uniref:YfiR family protein n=1 Tax=Desulfobacter latus TaxID=2292 RepID=A0A850SZQ5_9BACT|nr:YfiR family protein [Desulfobacter latus]NWH06774.1 YfiR family protein [Desulfobacter latus]
MPKLRGSFKMMRRKVVSKLVVVFLVLSFMAGGVAAQDWTARLSVSEYKLRAAYLYNFSKFIRWPDSAFASKDAAFVIGFFGEDAPMEIAGLLTSRAIGSRPIHVRQYRIGEHMDGCHMLYLQSNQEWKPVLKTLKSSRIITVGDAPSFADDGGAIQLLTIRNRLRFIINLKAPGFAGVDLDSRLLSLALEIKD